MFPIPVSVVTGFLGSGKTTLLNRLLKDPALKDTAVIINEFGDVGIDHLLVEQSSDGIIELSDGCLCCTVRGELVDTLADLIDRLQSGKIKALSRIVIETTGLADPAPVLAAIMGHPALVQALRLDGVITVVDAVNGVVSLDNHLEAVKQAAVADRIVLTKSDLISTDAELIVRLSRLNPSAQIVRANTHRNLVAALFNCGLYDPATKTADVARWLNEDGFHDREHERHELGIYGHDQGQHQHRGKRHDQSITAFTLIHDQPLQMASVQMFLDLLQSTHGERLLRMKGIICVAEDPVRPLVIHAVQSTMHPPVWLRAWQGNDTRTRLVVITKDLSEPYVRSLFDAFIGIPALDRPDKEALSKNPLAVAGWRS